MKRRKHSRTKQSPMDNREKRWRPCSASRRPARCSREKKISFGRGFLICIRDFFSSTKGVTSKHGGSVLELRGSSIRQCSTGKLPSRIFCSLVSLSKLENRRRPRRKRAQ